MWGFGRLLAHVSLTEKLGRMRSAVRSFPFIRRTYALFHTLPLLISVSHLAPSRSVVPMPPLVIRPFNCIQISLQCLHLFQTLIFLPIPQGTVRVLRQNFRKPGSKPAGPTIAQSESDVGARSGILQAFIHIEVLQLQTPCTSFGEGVGVISSIWKFLVSARSTRLKHLSSNIRIPTAPLASLCAQAKAFSFVRFFLPIILKILHCKEHLWFRR